MSRAFEAPSPDGATVLGLLRGVGVFRVLAMIWALVGVIPSVDKFTRPAVAVILLGAMVAWTVIASFWLLLGRYGFLMRPEVVAAEFAIGLAAMLGDGFVYEAGRSVSLAWAWPAAAVMTIGISRGWRFGLPAAAAVLAASFVAESRLGTPMSPILGFSRTGLWVATGIMSGYVSSRLRRAETEVALARAREEVARRLHDGVLQTLAVIQRRSDDEELAALARKQEAELRTFLAGGGDETALAFEPELRELAQRFQETQPQAKVQVVVAPDVGEPTETALRALLGAVQEALANVGKHAAASSVTIYAEPADSDLLPASYSADRGRQPSLFVSVRDDGVGFEVATVTERMGLAGSIRGRIEAAGGISEVTSRPGRGTEVKLWV